MSRQARRHPPKRRPRRAWPAVALAVFVGLVVLGFALTRLGEDVAAPLSAEGEPTIGQEDAPVTVFLFEDYQCPHCAEFELGGGFDRVREQWVEPGHVRVVFKDLAFLGPGSVNAAEASQCVWRHAPDRWPAWHEAAFRAQVTGSEDWTTVENLMDLTERVGGVPMEAFEPCLREHRALDEVQEDREEAEAAGVSSTPTLVVNGERVPANDADAVERAIREAVQAAEDTA